MVDHQLVDVLGAPKALGPYSSASIFQNLVFVSGQGARNPATEQLAGAHIESQTEQSIRNVAAILDAAGSGLAHVLKCTIFLVDMADFQAMNAV